MVKKIVAATALTATMAFAQSEIDINVNNKSYELSGSLMINDIYGLDYMSKYYVGAGILRNAESSKPNHNLMNLNFKVLNAFPDAQGLTLGIGAKFVYLDHSHVDMNAIAFGIYGQYDITPRFHVDAQVHYSPKVLTYSDGDYHREARANVNFAIVNNGYIYAGYRDIKTKLDGKGSVKYNDNPYIGFKFLF